MSRPAIPGTLLLFLQHAFLLGLGTAVPAVAAVEGFHYTREVQVPAPGWVRVPLDLAALQHLAPRASDLHVLSPAGNEVPFRIEPAAPRSERRPVTVSRPARVDDGWEVAVDLGANPLPHERLFFQPVSPPLALPDRIDVSPDRVAWQPLAPVAGIPGEGEGDSGWIPFSYPVTGDRYLRFHWPRQERPPGIAAAEVEAVTGPTLSETSRDTECDTSQPGRAFCTLALPAAGQIVRRLLVEVAGGGRTGFRLEAPQDSRWRTLAEGVWQRREGPARHLIAGGPEPVADSVLRLELHGAVQDPPRLASWGVEIDVQTVLFRADEPGRYALAYGGAARAEAQQAGPPPPDEIEAIWLEAGTETEHSPPPLPVAVTAPAVRLGSRRLSAAWRVVAPSAQPGFLVRLELPDVVYRAARADLGNLRVVSGERQIPFYRWSPAAPALVARSWDLDPTRSSQRSRESELEIRLPELGLPLTELDLLAPARPMRRSVGVRYPEPPGECRRESGQRRNRPAAVRQTWECTPQPPLPCQERLPLPGHAPQTLSVRFQDGDNPPLADLEAAVWRRRDVLLFVWPEGDETAPVRLLVGPENLRTPSYDLAALGETLLSHPWQPAELSLEGDAASEPRWARWVMPVTLVIAGICLIVLLGRILSEA
jgi:hypothetical protein